MIEIYLILIIKIMNIPRKMWEEQRKAMLKLASYEDKSFITAEWLEKNCFERLNYDTFLYCNDAEEITARIVDTEAGIWKILIRFLDHGDTNELNICTLGQLRMFLAIESLENIANQLK